MAYSFEGTFFFENDPELVGFFIKTNGDYNG